MSNVIPFSVPRAKSQSGQIEALIRCFATQRRFGDDVFWLKENAELLNILYSSGLSVDSEHLAPYRSFYASIEKRMLFFPQYYRFLLSITQDLEALGLARGKAVPLANWVDAQSLVSAELSDLQRAEANRLLRRGGLKIASREDGLNERLHRFINHSQTFAVPNKKAAYELTHIVFISVNMAIRILRLAQQPLSRLNLPGFWPCLIKMLICCLKFALPCALQGASRHRNGRLGLQRNWAIIKFLNVRTELFRMIIILILCVTGWPPCAIPLCFRARCLPAQ